MRKSIKVVKIKELIQTVKNNLEVKYPLTESKKILLISLQKIRIVLSECINLGLIILLEKKLIKSSNVKEKNLENFFKLSKEEFMLTETEIKKIREIFALAKKQRQSILDFKRNEKVVILDDNLDFQKITLEKLKNFTSFIELIFQKVLLSEEINSRKV